MPYDVNLILTPKQASSNDSIEKYAVSRLGIPVAKVGRTTILRRSIDARGQKVKVNLKVRVFAKGENPETDVPTFNYQQVDNKPEVLVVGAGSAGLFASLRLIELGYKPIILERGKDVSSRKRDIAMLNRNQGLDPNSNYAFGEGGAGAFSDGKLFTRSHKRGDCQRILHTLHNHGAQDEILYETHPHIGTNVLPRVISSIRQTIEGYGGRIHFNSTVEEIIVENGITKGVTLTNGEKVEGVTVVLATGHSARDFYYSLNRQGIQLEAKPFAMGVRVEHPQVLIDSIQYHGRRRGDYLPAATYSLAIQVEGRGVYSFCMCPGGYIVPAATGSEEIVVNGMSPSGRSSQWANSGIVVEVRLEDIPFLASHNPLAGLQFQHEFERLAYTQVQKGLTAPAQRLTHFIEGKASDTLPQCSYHPGLMPSRVDQWLPDHLKARLQVGFREFGRRMSGFITDQAVVVGVESRTSSPVRIPRDPHSLEHIQVRRLFPCGEGAGYAGGIVSSAIDGERVAEAIHRVLLKG